MQIGGAAAPACLSPTFVFTLSRTGGVIAVVRLMRSVAALLLFAAAPGAAFAQAAQQTPENAQRFIVLNFPQSFQWAGGPDTIILTEPVVAPNNCTNVLRGHTFEGNRPFEFTLDWRYVAGVTPFINGVVRLAFRGNLILDLNFNAQALGDRAAFAMEFVRQHCDPAANTGF
jgi:hypothetical protein